MPVALVLTITTGRVDPAGRAFQVTFQTLWDSALAQSHIVDNDVPTAEPSPGRRKEAP